MKPPETHRDKIAKNTLKRGHETPSSDNAGPPKDDLFCTNFAKLHETTRFGGVIYKEFPALTPEEKAKAPCLGRGSG